MADVVTSAPSAGAAPIAGAAAPAPSAPSAPPEPASFEDALRGAMAGEDPAAGTPDGVSEANPAGEGGEPPAADGAEGDGTGTPAEAGQGEGMGDAESGSELELEDLPAARKEYLKRDPEARAAWYFQQDMKRLGMTVPEARELRKIFASPESAQFAMKRAVDYGAMERALTSDDPTAQLQFLDTLRQKFGTGAERFVRTIAQNIDAVDPRGALERDAVKMAELLGDLEAGADDLGKEALKEVWALLEQRQVQTPAQREARDPERRELEAYRARERQRVADERATVNRSVQEAADGEIKTWVDEAFQVAKTKYGVPGKILKDLGDALYRETREYLKGHALFQEEFINARDKAPSSDKAKEAAVAKVRQWGRTFLLDVAAQRLKPYTKGVLQANQRRLTHAKEIGTLAELGGTTAAAGVPVKLPENLSMEERARILLR